MYLANRVIDFDGLVWKTSPGAWEVEPPGRSSGPCSTTVMSVQPRATSSSARLVPTMPAPMMTTRAGCRCHGIYPCVWSVRVSGRRRCCAPWSRIRFSQCQRTARDRARHSASWPTVAERPRVVGVVDPDHLLLDDRTLVEVGGHVVRGRSDQLHAAGVGLVVGLGALEAGQERVVDVDRAAFEGPAEVVGQDLHVAGQHHQVDVVLVDQLQQPGFGLGLGVRR